MPEPIRPVSAPGTPPLQEQEQPEQAKASPRATLEEPVESPPHLVWLLLRDPARLSETELHMLTFMRQEPVVELAYTLAQRFIHLMHEHQAAKLESWISTCISSGISDMEAFAVGLRKELSAIKAAFTLSYSTAPVEGQVNRLKLIKRCMYSRGSLA